jgi:WD40 repeat protein/mono/diheme cytochrome c family protein
MHFRLMVLIALVLVGVPVRSFAEAKSASYAEVHAIFAKHCLACHDSNEAEGELVLETPETILAGGQNGAVIVPGSAEKSVLVRQIERLEKPFMPPPKKAEKLSDAEIGVIRSWIDGGALGRKPGESVAVATTQALPHIDPKVTPRRSVQAVAYAPKMDWLAVARAGEIEIRTAKTQTMIRTLSGHHGNVNDVAFTADGKLLAAGAGQVGRGGEVRIWNVADGTLVHTFEGHADAVYSLAISPDATILATGSYDQKIILWDLVGKKMLRKLEGHNGAVFALAFRNDGKVLASGSADRTVKLWDVSTGKRLDTRPESLKDQLTLTFTPDGQRLLSGGADNRVRVWKIGPTAAEGSNPLLEAHFAHEGAILKLAISSDGKTLVTSADDRTVKLWNLADFRQKSALPQQPDWPSAVAFVENDKVLVVGRLDGSLAFYDVASGKEIPSTKAVAKTAKPAVNTLLTEIEPRGVQRGHSIHVRLIGKTASDITAVKTNAPKVIVKLLAADEGKTPTAELIAAADAPLGAFDLSVTGADGQTQAQKFVIDDLPQLESTGNHSSSGTAMLATTLPVTFGGKFGMKGEADYFAIDGKADQKIVLDVAAKRAGSKAAVTLWLIDSAGRTIAIGEDVEGDPILEATLPADGRYFIRVAEQSAAASGEHYYRIAVGDLHVVTGAFPLGAAPNKSVNAQLLGFNLPPNAEVTVKTAANGEASIPIDNALFRVRRQPSLIVGVENAELDEVEPNDTPAQAMAIPVPGAVNGTIAARGSHTPDVDIYRFRAKAGQLLVLETMAARRGSPIDTRIEILWPNGKPVERLQLQAVRDSYLNFRPADANQLGTRLQNWEEMELNQFVYLNGEVAKLFRMPQGPDSDLLFYASNGKRRCYFDTSATAHALEDKAYIVEPHAPGEKLSPNGLPVFPIYYANDDDETRQLGSDSRLLFTAPVDGEYLVRVSDVRGFGGVRYVYRLVVRDANPDFSVVLAGVNASIPPGSGRNFTVKVDRIDGYDGPVRVDFSQVPPGFAVSTPIVVEAGHDEARGTIYAAVDAKTPAANAPPVKFVASASIADQMVTKPAGEMGRLAAAGNSQVLVRLDPYVEGQGATTQPTTQLAVIDVIPGRLTKAWLRVQRNGQKGRITFEVENLPHGVIVADIGLNGVLIPEDQSERMIFLQCAPWVKPTTRPCHARANEAGNATSSPVMVRVRGSGE